MLLRKERSPKLPWFLLAAAAAALLAAAAFLAAAILALKAFANLALARF
jgi:hypothetical protein